jgi:hypothetical protein
MKQDKHETKLPLSILYLFEANFNDQRTVEIREVQLPNFI